MFQLKKLLKADIIKLKSTQMLWAHLYIPLLGLIIFLSYYSYTPWSNLVKISTYLQVLCMVFPILIGIITSMVAEQEYEAGNYKNILTSSERKYFSFVSKVITFLLLGTFSTILAVIGFYVGFSFIESDNLPFGMYLSAVGLLIGSNIFLYILHLFLSFRFSKGVSIGIGILESLISALFLTGMGDGIWLFFPSSWSMRFTGYLLMNYQNISDIFRSSDLYLGITMSIVGTFLSWLITLLWFTNWEGKKAEE